MSLIKTQDWESLACFRKHFPSQYKTTGLTKTNSVTETPWTKQLKTTFS